MSSSAIETEWVDIEAGSFWMGGGPRANENPRHRVSLGGFRLARTQVTREQFQVFADETNHPLPPFWNESAFDHPRMPAVGPSWDDAVAFCDWASDQHGYLVRLPTEAEWERAARGGRDVEYPWGNEPPERLPDYERRWLDGPEPVDAYDSLHPWGFLGLCENVHEWCSDWYSAEYYSRSESLNPRGPSEGRRRSSRGGSWRHAIKASRCAHRSSIPPHFRYSDYGFRLAADQVETAELVAGFQTAHTRHLGDFDSLGFESDREPLPATSPRLCRRVSLLRCQRSSVTARGPSMR